jgi:hypothetical protein
MKAIILYRQGYLDPIVVNKRYIHIQVLIIVVGITHQLTVLLIPVVTPIESTAHLMYPAIIMDHIHQLLIQPVKYHILIDSLSNSPILPTRHRLDVTVPKLNSRDSSLERECSLHLISICDQNQLIHIQ